MIKGIKRNHCFKGLHLLTPENTWIRPSDGARYCRACQKAARRARTDHFQESSIKRGRWPTKEETKAFEASCFNSGYQAFNDGLERAQWPRHEKKYSYAWYRQKSNWTAGWDAAQEKQCGILQIMRDTTV